MRKLLESSTFTKVLFSMYLVLHVVLINVNAAEWGDSYRILRASEYIREGSYPEDEKRPPLYSAFLALRPASVDQVTWGRLLMLGVSVLSFYLFYQIAKEVLVSSRAVNIALTIFALNPVYLYWSLRLMADVFFSAFVLCAFYIYLRLRKSGNVMSQAIYVITLGIISTLAVLTRFEGYILLGTCGLSVLLLGYSFLKRLTYGGLVGLSFLSTILPYWLYKNPLESSYFEEPSSRAYDLDTVFIYLVSYMFVFGFIYAFYFLLTQRLHVARVLKAFPFISIYVVVESILILLWPAAIPRLFTPIIPFLCLLLGMSIAVYFAQTSRPKLFLSLLLLIVLPVVFVFAQYLYKLQFLILSKPVFVIVLIFSILQAYAILRSNLAFFYTSLVVTLLLWSLATIWIHKDIFAVVKDANLFIVKNLQGVVGYNDVSSVSAWYLNESSKEDTVSGIYYDATKKSNREKEALQAKNIDYLLVTNEHNTDMDFDIAAYPHLSIIREFKKEINGAVFFTKVIKVIID